MSAKVHGAAKLLTTPAPSLLLSTSTGAAGRHEKTTGFSIDEDSLGRRDQPRPLRTWCPMLRWPNLPRAKGSVPLRLTPMRTVRPRVEGILARIRRSSGGTVMRFCPSCQAKDQEIERVWRQIERKDLEIRQLNDELRRFQDVAGGTVSDVPSFSAHLRATSRTNACGTVSCAIAAPEPDVAESKSPEQNPSPASTTLSS